MALIGILSLGVYNSYLILIRQTKDGEIKQNISLVGQQTIEKIKSIEYFTGELNLNGENVIFDKHGEKYRKELLLDNKYKITNDADKYAYTEEVEISPSKSNLEIKSKNFEEEAINTLILKENEMKFNDESTEFLMGIKTLNIGISAGGTITIEGDNSFNETYDLKKTEDLNNNNLKIDGANYDEEISVYIRNDDEEPLILYLNKSGNEFIKIEKEEGKFKTVYDNLASHTNNKKGKLYDIAVTIKDKNGKILFVGNFIQNIEG